MDREGATEEETDAESDVCGARGAELDVYDGRGAELDV